MNDQLSIDLYYYLDGRLQRRAGRGILPTMGTVAPPLSGQKFRGSVESHVKRPKFRSLFSPILTTKTVESGIV